MMNGLFIAGAALRLANERSQAAAEKTSDTDGASRIPNRDTQLDIEKLFMITEALWILLKQQHGYTDEQLVEMIYDIDLRDGQLDGKVAKPPSPPCEKCGRILMGRHPVCLYCGAVAVRGPFER